MPKMLLVPHSYKTAHESKGKKCSTVIYQGNKQSGICLAYREGNVYSHADNLTSRVILMIANQSGKLLIMCKDIFSQDAISLKTEPDKSMLSTAILQPFKSHSEIMDA